jgi:hypothetical protein
VYFVVSLLAGLGVARIPTALRAAGVRDRRVAVAVATVVAAAALAAPSIGRARFVPVDRGDVRAPSYRALASWLADNTDRRASVAFVEVGYLGYFAPNPIVDLVGLVTPDVLPGVLAGDFGAGFWRHRPAYFVHLPEFDWALGGIVSDPRLADAYRPVARLPGPYDGAFTIYRRIEPGPDR